jgi:urease accessory protein UreE
MALKEKSVVDKIEVLLNGSIQVRRRDQILKNGVEVASTFHRHIIAPGDDVSNEDDRVAAVATTLWTEEVVAAYQAAQEETPAE